MIEKKRDKSRVALTLLDAAASVAVLILSLRLVGVFSIGLEETFNIDNYNYSSMYGAAAAVFLILSVQEVVRWFGGRGGTKRASVRHLLGVGLFFLSGILLLALQGDYLSASVAGGCYGVTLVLSRVEAIRRDRRKRSIVINSFALLLIAALLGTLMRLLFLPVFLILISFFHIGGVAFSQIDFRRLEKVIRKTYAVEIIFGMLLLMVAFSIVLSKTESSMETFGDALWYCFAIVTTIGFGDITATGVVGRILSVILGVYGIIVVSLITSVIVNFYNEVKNEPDAEAPPEKSPEKENAEEETP
jgi:hypothetical protein